MIFKYSIHAIIMDYHFLIYIFGYRIHWKVHISSIYKRTMQKTVLNTCFYHHFFLLWFETSVHFWSCFYQSFRIIAQIRIWNLGSLPIEKLFSCQSLVNFGLTYITLEVTIIRNTSSACPRRGLYVLIKAFWQWYSKK